MSDPQFPRPRRRTNDRASDRLAAFFVMDIQRSPDWARDLLVKITDVKTGVLPSWERIGNAYRLHLSAEGALIEDLVDPTSAPQRVPLEELEAAVTAWIATAGYADRSLLQHCLCRDHQSCRLPREAVLAVD